MSKDERNNPHSAPTRRQFLATGAMGMLGVATADGSASAAQSPPTAAPAGAPPAFGTAAAVGPEVSSATFAEAEKLVAVSLTASERQQAAGNWRNSLAPLYERRTGPKKLSIETSLAPWSRWESALPGTSPGPVENRFVSSRTDAGPLPSKDEDIAFASVTHLSQWIETRKLTSERLTKIYLARLKKFDPTLHCVITLTEELALAQAKQADVEIAAGHYRGPLHGIPWGAKDLLDTAGIHTTYGAEPFRDRIPSTDATVVERLHAAGAVLVAKLSMGALALNDIWFGGETLNPWLLEEGSSGSSAGAGIGDGGWAGRLFDRQRDRR